VINLDNNTITSCDCGLPALPSQVVIEGYRSSTPPRKYKNGQVVQFGCNDWIRDYLIGSNISVCINGNWNKKSGVCGN
jgi:hypothetical protein